MFRCYCGSYHISQLVSESVLYLGRVVERNCPVSKSKIYIQLKDDDGKIIPPLGVIKFLPNYYCKKCRGSGRYTYFHKTFTCECIVPDNQK